MLSLVSSVCDLLFRPHKLNVQNVDNTNQSPHAQEDAVKTIPSSESKANSIPSTPAEREAAALKRLELKRLALQGGLLTSASRRPAPSPVGFAMTESKEEEAQAIKRRLLGLKEDRRQNDPTQVRYKRPQPRVSHW